MRGECVCGGVYSISVKRDIVLSTCCINCHSSNSPETCQHTLYIHCQQTQTSQLHTAIVNSTTLGSDIQYYSTSTILNMCSQFPHGYCAVMPSRAMHRMTGMKTVVYISYEPYHGHS